MFNGVRCQEEDMESEKMAKRTHFIYYILSSTSKYVHAKLKN